MGLIKRLRAEGYRVIVISQFDGYERQVALEVDEIRPLFISRRGVNPFTDIFTVMHIVKYLYIFQPYALLLFSIKPVIYGSIAARIMKVKSIAMITGLGTVFISNSWITSVVKILYRFSLVKSSTVFFQNQDDKNLFISNGLVKSSICRLIPGSGVDLDKFSQADPPESEYTTFLLIARMLWDKGVGEFVEASKNLRRRYPLARFKLLGPLGVENRTAISASQMENWINDGSVEYLGQTDDVGPFISEASCIVLPSYREGTSRVLLEAAAMGRPIVATDVPGCREVVEDQVTGFLCRPRNYLDLADKLELMLNLSTEERQAMGAKGRAKIEKEFDQSLVFDLYLNAVQK
jgi:glycosyltransferase involved in cell wall biosynthesis